MRKQNSRNGYSGATNLAFLSGLASPFTISALLAVTIHTSTRIIYSSNPRILAATCYFRFKSLNSTILANPSFTAINPQ